MLCLPAAICKGQAQGGAVFSRNSDNTACPEGFREMSLKILRSPSVPTQTAMTLPVLSRVPMMQPACGCRAQSNLQIEAKVMHKATKKHGKHRPKKVRLNPSLHYCSVLWRCTLAQEYMLVSHFLAPAAQRL